MLLENACNECKENEDELVHSFNKCIKEISMLRKIHLNIATRYLSVTKTGTGTSTFRTLLKECIKDTDNSTVDTKDH